MAKRNNNQEMIDYIRQSAQARGIDPDIALRVARGEGGLYDPFRHGEAKAPKSQAAEFGSKENSFGPFQLYISGTGAGLGDRALAAGIDPRTNWKGGVDYALNEVSKKGWGQWYGAKANGITGMMGVGGNAGAVAPTAMASAAPIGVTSDAASNAVPTPGITLNSGGAPGIAATAGAMPAAQAAATPVTPPTKSIGDMLMGGDVKGALKSFGDNKNAMGGLASLAGALGGGNKQAAAAPTMAPPQIQDNSGAIAQGAQQMMSDLLRRKQIPGLSLGGFGAMG